ncbi:Dos2-interacting transcription regulator of RNA-Pol-II-domain-containing protein [Pilobolus umbonatus]|nr:Dos2-interacting transcription regulator of RNA-Pol-II-domain-containing protein [Pilobolus umbonatus]
MDILQLLKNWFMSEKSDLEPSLLAYVLLFTTKNVTGLIIIMEHLTTFWNEDEARNKAKCTELLAQVVLPSQSDLDSKSVQAIISFLTRGLKDVTTAGRSIDILSILINAEHIQRTDVILLCDAIFKNVQMKKLPQNSRWKVFNILDTALEKYSLELQASKVNFIEGFIDCMDGEKDPRNLLIAFHLFRTLIDKFDISQHVEELFDVVFCYFPISFTAPAGDILGITSSELKESLRRCFAATPYFGYFATPLLIEKLMKSTGTAKKDAMETISLCTPAYGANVILPHVDELFKALVKEVYQGTDITTVNIALNTIYHVVATLATGVSIANIRDPVEKSIGSLLDQCVDKLSEPELKNARSASHILRAVASASDPACTSVTHAVLPVLYEKYSPRDPIIRQKAILDILTELLTASKNLYGSIENLEYDRDFQTPLLIYKQQIMQIFVLSLIESSAEDASLMESCLRGIHEMISMKQFLNNGEIDITVNHLSRLLIDRGNQLKSLILPTLKIVAKAYPTILRKHTFPMLFHLLPSEATPVISDNYKEVLEMIEILGLYPATFKIIVASLMENLNYACYSIGVYNSEYVHAIAHTILHLYKSTSADKEILQYGIKSLIPLFMKKCIEYSTTSDKHWYLDIDLLNIFSMIIAVTVRQSRTSEQEEAVNDLFRQLDYSTLLISPRTFLLEILKTIQNTTSDNKRASLTKLFATIINKWADGKYQ